MVSLEGAEEYLVDIERGLLELQKCCDSKQSERFLSNASWMGDFLENKLRSKLNGFKDSLKVLKETNAVEFKSGTQFEAIIVLCDENNKFLEELAKSHKMMLRYGDISLKINQNLPKMQERTKSMRNRFNIIKGQINRAVRSPFDDDDW